jgi:hypothetical protein
MNVTDQDSRLQELHLLGRGDGPLNFPTIDQRCRIDRSLDDRMWSDYEDALAVNLTFEATIHSNRSFQVDRAFNPDVLAKDCKVFRVDTVVRSYCIMSPHKYSFPPEAPSHHFTVSKVTSEPTSLESNTYAFGEHEDPCNDRRQSSIGASPTG